MINRNLNYGRHLIKKFLKASAPYEYVLDLGAGRGNDLVMSKEIQPNAQLYAMESHPPYINELKEKNINVFSANIERDKLPFKIIR